MIGECVKGNADRVEMHYVVAYTANLIKVFHERYAVDVQSNRRPALWVVKQSYVLAEWQVCQVRDRSG